MNSHHFYLSFRLVLVSNNSHQIIETSPIFTISQIHVRFKQVRKNQRILAMHINLSNLRYIQAILVKTKNFLQSQESLKFMASSDKSQIKGFSSFLSNFQISFGFNNFPKIKNSCQSTQRHLIYIRLSQSG